MKRIIILLFFLFIFGCASTYESSAMKKSVKNSDSVQKEKIQFPKYTGKKTRIAVLPIALTQKTIKDFPEYTKELRKKSVGFSLWNRITEALYDTHRFTLVEISEEIVKKIIDQWWLGQSGMVDPSTALQMGKLKQAQNFIYGEITEFGVDKVEKIKGLKAKTKTIYRIGVQLRYVNGETLEYIPATAIGKGETIEEASEIAIRKAILKLLERME